MEHRSASSCPGRRFMWAVNDMPDLAAYGLISAALCDPAGTDCVQPSTDSVTTALNSATTDSAGLLEVNPAKVPAGGYPLTEVVYAAVPTNQSAAALTDYADFIAYAAGQGQTAGSTPGDLPPGYLPLTSSLQAQAQSVVTQLQALAGASAHHVVAPADLDEPDPASSTGSSPDDGGGAVDADQRATGPSTTDGVRRRRGARPAAADRDRQGCVATTPTPGATPVARPAPQLADQHRTSPAAHAPTAARARPPRVDRADLGPARRAPRPRLPARSSSRPSAAGGRRQHAGATRRRDPRSADHRADHRRRGRDRRRSARSASGRVPRLAPAVRLSHRRQPDERATPPQRLGRRIVSSPAKEHPALPVQHCGLHLGVAFRLRPKARKGENP